MPALFRLYVVALLLLVGTGCQVTLTTGVDAEMDGSGVVRAAVGLDDEALRELGDPARELRLDDLRAAGWEASEPRKEADGLTWIRLARRFSSPEEANQVAADLSGPEGPFREFQLSRTRSFLKTRTTFTGLVDLSRGLAGLSDARVQERLGDADLGLDPEGLQRRLAADAGDKLSVRVEARLPGDVESNAPGGRDGRVAWEPKVGEQLRLQATSEAWNLQPLLPAAAALALVVAALVMVARGRDGGWPEPRSHSSRR